MRRTTEALVKAFDGQWSREAALAPRADECVHIVLPSSRKVPPKHNAEWSESFRPIESMGITGKVSICALAYKSPRTDRVQDDHRRLHGRAR